MNKFQELVDVKKDTACVFTSGNARAIFAADLGARVFCELDGQLLHRLDIDNVKNPNKPFNNYGGNNYWPRTVQKFIAPTIFIAKATKKQEAFFFLRPF